MTNCVGSMEILMKTVFDIWNAFPQRSALEDYPWHQEMGLLFDWLKNQSNDMYGFVFDVMMSLAYIESTNNIAENLETCPSTIFPYNAQIGFINLCACCYNKQPQLWQFQKAAKPSSGLLGKISSEMTLKFIKNLNANIVGGKIIGGTGTVDAALLSQSDELILAEIKSAPLLTYPILFHLPKHNFSSRSHEKPQITQSQLKNCDTALFLHNGKSIPLGKQGDVHWPFASAIRFLCDKDNFSAVEQAKNLWLSAKRAYISKDKTQVVFYLTNACGRPPSAALEQGWPKRESISDGKTSAGLDRTDDIKKGIYQTFKIATEYADIPNVRTALISNLPPYRHYDEYVLAFIDILWGKEKDLQAEGFPVTKLKRVFDYIITLDEKHSVLRDKL